MDKPNPFSDDQWYPLKLGRTCFDDAATRFYSLRYEFKPASIDNSRSGTLHSSKGKATVEFFNNQAGKPKVAFEGNMGDYQELDAMLFYDGDSFHLERMHRSVRNLRHIRVPGESSAAAATTAVVVKEADHESPPNGNGNNTEKTIAAPSRDNKSLKKPADQVSRSEKIEADESAPAPKRDPPSGPPKKKGGKKGPLGTKGGTAKKASPKVAAPAPPAPSPPNRKREREPSPVNVFTEEVAEESPSKKGAVVEEEQVEAEEVVDVSEEVVESDYEEVDISEDEEDKTGVDQTAATLRAQAKAGLLETKASSSSSSSASESSESGSGSGSSSSDSGTDEEGSASSGDDGEDI